MDLAHIQEVLLSPRIGWRVKWMILWWASELRMRCRKIIERLPILQRSRHCVCVHGKNCWMVPSAHCGLLKSLPETMSRNLQKFDLIDRRQIVLANPFLSLLLIKEMLVLSCAKHRRSSSLHSHSPFLSLCECTYCTVQRKRRKWQLEQQHQTSGGGRGI